MNSLRFVELERRFLRLISQPDPVLERARADPESLPLRSWIQAPSEAVAAARLGIYAHMYFARLRDSLREDFALFAGLVSEQSFDRLAALYLERHPSVTPSLRYHGRHFAGFLQRGIRDREPAFLSLRPDAPALCRLEWARIEVFDAKNSSPLGRNDLATLAPEAWGELRLSTCPAVQLIEADHCASELWAACEGRHALPSPRQQSERVLIWRRGFQVYHRPVDVSEARALESLAIGAAFVDICQCFSDSETPLEAATEHAFRALLQWLADEILTWSNAARNDPSARIETYHEGEPRLHSRS